MNTLRYRVDSLPDEITIGRKSENGVLEVRIDCTAWLAYWPKLVISAWVTAPGGDYSYPPATSMDGNVLVWSVSNSDTAVEGYGTLEIVGITAEQKKLSAATRTRVLHTTTPTTSNPPPASQPWVDRVLLSAQRAEKAASSAAQSADKAESVALVKSVNGKTGNVNLSASDVGALPADSTATNANLLGGKTPGNYTPAHNWLVNSDMTNVINQRGASSYTGQVYGIDRWYGRAVAQTVSVRSADVTVTATGTSYAGIKQKVHGMPRLAGKTVTFAARLYANVVPELVLFDSSEQSLAVKMGTAGATQTIILTYTVPSDATADSVVPTILLRTTASGDYMRIVWAALYEGSYTADTLPAYQPKGYAAELAECRRYYKVIDVNVAPWLSESTTLRRYYVGYEPMRTAPTVDVSGLKEYAIWTDLGSALNPYNIKNNRVLLSATSETTSTRLYIGGSIALSADL